MFDKKSLKRLKEFFDPFQVHVSFQFCSKIPEFLKYFVDFLIFNKNMKRRNEIFLIQSFIMQIFKIHNSSWKVFRRFDDE